MSSFIEKAYLGKTEAWRYLLLPAAFIAFMSYNYFATLSAGQDTNVMMKVMIEQLGATPVLVLLLMPLVFGFFVLLVYGLRVLKMPLTALFTSRSNFDWGRMFFGFFLWSAVVISTTLLDYLLAPENYVFQFNWKSFWPFAIAAILLIPLQTSFEELLFRGHLTQGLGVLTKRRSVAFIVPSVIFGVMHIGNPEVAELGYKLLLYYIGSGLFFGAITLIDEGTELALGFHASNNLVGALLVSSDWTAFQVPSIFKDVGAPSFGWDALIPVVVIYPLIIALLAKKYQWQALGSKLFGTI
ncbi:MAG: hypothetical protein RLZZ242_625 [Bacteroidota bacterium]